MTLFLPPQKLGRFVWRPFSFSPRNDPGNGGKTWGREVTIDAMFWGRIGWFFAIAIIGVVIWYFKVHRDRPPH
jgi:hypothetical protein